MKRILAVLLLLLVAAPALATEPVNATSKSETLAAMGVTHPFSVAAQIGETHVCATFDGHDLRCYINERLTELRGLTFWSRAITADEIKTVHNNGQPLTTEQLNNR